MTKGLDLGMSLGDMSNRLWANIKPNLLSGSDEFLVRQTQKNQLSIETDTTSNLTFDDSAILDTMS